MKKLNSRRSQAQTGCSLMGKNATRLRATSAWRALAASGIVAGAGFLAGGNAALADPACTTLATTLTCTGDQTNGVSATDPIDTLNVNNLILPIIPASGVSGIFFQSTGAITVNSDTTGILGGVVPTITTSQADGIALESTGGSVTLDHTGAILAVEAQGVSAISVGGVDLDIDGAISSDDAGIFVVNQVGGTATSITHYGAILSSAGPGIDVTTSSTSLLIDNTGNIETFGDGISAVNNSTSTADGTTIDQTGNILAGGRGIYALSDGGDIDVTSNGWIASDGTGVQVLANVGDADVNQSGYIISQIGGGIEVEALDGAATVTGSGSIQSYRDGLFAQAKGADGEAKIDWSGDVTSTNGKGFYAYSDNGPTTVESDGDINSHGEGIFAMSNGSSDGDTTVTQFGNITSQTSKGIYAYSANGAVTVDVSDGDISAGADGIFAQSDSSEKVKVTFSGDIIQAGGYGVYASSATGIVEVAQYGEINSDGDAIFASSSGSSKVTVDHTGDIDAGGKGIYAYSSNGAVTVTMASGDINSGSDAIYAANEGSGTVSVSHTGDIDHAGGYGVFASSASGVVDVKQYGAIHSTMDAIFAANTDSNSVTVDHTGDIVSTSGSGINATSSQGTVTVTMASGDITADGYGIFVKSQGGSAVSVVHTGEIVQAGSDGVYAYSATGTVTVMQYGAVKADGKGIRAENEGYSAVLVEQTGDIDSGLDGIFAQSTNGAVTVTKTDGDITAGGIGILAKSSGTEEVLVDLTGNILQSTTGIDAKSGTAKLTVNVDGSITSSASGVIANSDAGVIEVTTGGDIDAGSDGIYAKSTGGASVTVAHTGDIKAGDSGIFAANDGGSSLDVTMNGNITQAGEYGVYAYSSTATVTVKQYGTINSVLDGIHAENSALQTVAVERTGDIASTSGNGIYAYSSQGAVDIVMTSGNISAAKSGIHAENLGSAPVDVAFTGNIVQAGEYGVYAFSSGGSVSIDQYGSVNSTLDGLHAETTGGPASATIDHTGNIASLDGNGVFARATSGTVTVTMTSGDISAGKSGVHAENTSNDAVEVEYTGNVTQAGEYGVYAYSSGGTVSVMQYGDINATKDGIFAKNLGLAGVAIDHTGDIDSTAGTGIYAYSGDGVISVSHDAGTITAAKDGIHVRSYGAQTVNIGSEGSVTGADGYAGVYFKLGSDVEGSSNKLINYGSIDNAGGISKNAVFADGGHTIIENYGTISGNVDLYEWSNAFNNHSGALFNMGSVVDLGAYDDNVLTNDGTVSSGGVNNVQTTALTGSLTNTATGTMLFDVDMDNSVADRIDATNLASLDGDLKLNFVSFDATPGDYIILTASNVTTQNLALANPFVQGSITYENGDTEVHLSVDGFNFTPTGITGNAAEISEFIGNSFNGGSNGLDPLMLALLNLSDLDAAQDALTQLSPNVYMSQQIAALSGSIGFADKLLSCRVADGAYAFGAEGQCAWARGGYRAQNFDGADGTGFDSAGFDFAAGAQVNGGGDWRFGAALGVTTSNTDGDNNASSDGTAFQAGAVAKYAPGPYLFAAAVSGSWGSYDNTRHVDFMGFSDKLEGDSDVYSLNARLRAAFTLEQNNMYMRPMVDLNATYIHTGAFTESGGVAAISVDSSSGTVFSLSPAIEIGGQMVARNGALLRPYLRGGVSLFSHDDVNLSGQFVADTAGVDWFTVTTQTDDMLWNVAAGLDVLSMDGKTLQLFYQGSFGDKTSDNLGGIKYSVNF